MKSQPEFCSSNQARPDPDLSISKHSSPSSPAQYPPTLLSLTIKLPKPPLKWISTNKFHSKETNWSLCAMSCSAGSPLGCLGRQSPIDPPPFHVLAAAAVVRVKDCLPRNPRHPYLWSDYIYFISPVSYCMATTDNWLAEPQGCNWYLNKDTSRLLNGSVHRKQI